jgi:inhibitor of cysteine peptidase
MMNRIAFFILALTVAALLQSCTTENEDAVKVTGTIVFLSFEGGFYGILGDDGKHYDPTNMSQEFQKDGLRVRFEAKALQGMASYHQWGTLVELVTIHKL